MKLKPTLLLLTMLIWCSSAVGQDAGKPQTSKELGNAIFQSLQTNDFDAFESLILNESDIETMLTNAGVPDTLMDRAKGYFWGTAEATRQNAKAKFEDALKPFEEKKFDWANAEVLQVFNGEEEKQGLVSTEIMVFINSGSLSFILQVNKCFKGDSWFMLNEIALLGHKEDIPEEEYVEKHLMKDKLEDGWYSLDQKGNDFFGNALHVNDTTITLWEEWKSKAVFYRFKNIVKKDGWIRYNYEMDGSANEYYVQYKRNEGEDTYSIKSEWVAYSDDVRIDLDMANYNYVTLRVLTKDAALKKH